MRTIRRADVLSMQATVLPITLEEQPSDPNPLELAKYSAFQQTPRQVISGSSVP
jgi:hypothetical protein